MLQIGCQGLAGDHSFFHDHMNSHRLLFNQEDRHGTFDSESQLAIQSQKRTGATGF